VLEVIGRNPEALATYEEMFEYAREHGDVALEMESLLLQGILHSISDSDRERALSLAKRGETLACELGDRKAQARALWIEQLTYTYTYAPEKAIASGEQALAIAREVEAPELVGYILGDLSRVYQNLNLEKARTLTNDARMIWRSLDNKPMLADSLGASAWLAYNDGDFDKSLSYSREGLEISKTVGSKLGQMFNESVQLSTSLDLGDVADALENAEASLVEAKNMARDLNRPMRLTQLALALGILGSYDRAQDLARRAREILEQPMQSFFKVMGWGILAQYYVTIGDLDAAQTAFGNTQTNDVWVGVVTFSEYLLARGDYGEAARLSEREVAHRRQLGYIQPLPGLLYVQARSVRALGKTEQALELLTQARVAAEKISHRRLLWQIYSLLSEMERERGAIPEAEQFQARAREVIDFIVDHTPPELRDSFLAQPAVHAIMDTQ
jgi:tetratricopeptide (TPR) repeat protein